MLCAFCNSQMRPLFSSRDTLHPERQTEYQVAWCEHCGYGRVDGQFSHEEIAGFYPSEYYTHGKKKDRRPTLAERVIVGVAWRLDRSDQFSASDVAGKTACDIGCGSGEHMLALQRAGFDVVGVEPDPKSRELAQNVGPAFAGTAENLPVELSGRRFDVVLMSHSLEHCRDPIAAIQNLSTILNHDGKIIIEVPNADAYGFRALGPVWPFSDVPRHLQFFTSRSLGILGEKAGLTVKKIAYAGYTRHFQRMWREQLRINADLTGYPRAQPALSYLARTAMLPASKKYDSVRVHLGHQ